MPFSFMSRHGICSHSISDTIPGRQCMASCFFLLKQFDDVLIYLNSFKVSIEFSRWFVYKILYIICQREDILRDGLFIMVASANSLCLFLCLSYITDVFLFYMIMLNVTYSWDVFQSYFYNDDIFNFNYAQAKAATGNTSEGEEVGTCFGRHSSDCLKHCSLFLTEIKCSRVKDY